jgi:hypothetical protein
MGESKTTGQYSEVEVEITDAGPEPELSQDRPPGSEKQGTIYDGAEPGTTTEGGESSEGSEGGEGETGSGDTEKEETIYDG